MTIQKLITGLAHVGIRVHELARSRAFYESIGFDFIAGPLGPEPVAILTHPSGIVLNLILNASAADSENMLMDIPDKHPGYTHMSLAVTDLEAVQSEIEARGIRITEGPIDFGPTARGFFVRDPDENFIEFNHTNGPAAP